MQVLLSYIAVETESEFHRLKSDIGRKGNFLSLIIALSPELGEKASNQIMKLGSFNYVKWSYTMAYMAPLGYMESNMHSFRLYSRSKLGS
jgi:hypothetical protein